MGGGWRGMFLCAKNLTSGWWKILHFNCMLSVLLSFQALAQLADGSVASGVGVMVKVTINNDVTTLFEDELLSENEEGAVSLDIAVPAHAKCMKISVSTCTLLY